MDALACCEGGGLAFELQCGCTGENVEELACICVKVLEFTCAGRNPFLNDAQVLMLEQMPPVADIAPYVVFGVRWIDG